MNKRRPTILIGNWKLAIHLAATSKVQNQKDSPAHSCNCEWCSKWQSAHEKLLPENLLHQLRRVGIEVESPTDLYSFESTNSGNAIRVVFHAVGKILSGPNPWLQATYRERALSYNEVREQPWVGLVVFPQSQSFDFAPSVTDETAGELLRIDLTLVIPHEGESGERA